MLSSQLLGNHDSYPSNPTRKGLSNKCALNGTPLTWTTHHWQMLNIAIPVTIPPKENNPKKTHWNETKWMCWYVWLHGKIQPNPPPKKKKTDFPHQKLPPRCSRWPFFPPPFRAPTMTWPVGWVNPRLTPKKILGVGQNSIWCSGPSPLSYAGKVNAFVGGSQNNFENVTHMSQLLRPQNMLFRAQNHPFPNFFTPPNPKKMGVDRKHLELCNKNLQLLKNSTAPLFGAPEKPTQNVKERDRWTTMGHDIHPSPKVLGGWKCRKPLPDMGH